MARKKTDAQRAVDHARKVAEYAASWVDVHNAIFGIGGKAAKLFADQSSRAEFVGTAEYAEIQEIIAGLREKGDTPMADASGKFSLRLPKTVHGALIAEAEAEGVSLNQLCMSKLSLQLRAQV